LTITAFTLAHSITLSLATLGIVQVPGPPVEAAIALSILLLACEIMQLQRGDASLTARWPWVVAFSFGLLHGFGFASALTEIGLPRGDIPLALFAFNVGVETGQLIFIAAVLGALRYAKLIKLPAFVECHAVGHNLCDRNPGGILVYRAIGRICPVSDPVSNVRFGSNSEVGGRNREVRITPESRLNSDIAECPKGANFGSDPFTR
jgi:hypothetical protein